MDRRHPVAGWRAAAFAVALFAITLNFLQPLVHAALMRDGGSEIWAAMCLPGASAESDRDGATPVAGKLHECCLGLAHAGQVSPPPTTFVAVDLPSPSVERPVLALDAMAPVGIRDGPSQPRGPPLPV
ncbi:MAG: hypothetical protein U1E60_30490 [Reyranellaceae bacterium]